MTPFSPLFIGEVSSTREGQYQSTCCYCLSVPSSLGKSLQPYPNNPDHPEAYDFQSPLHWGSLFNRIAVAPNADRVPLFQSPLHWGSLFNDFTERGPSSTIVIFQSPLHWGSLFNEQADAKQKADQLAFSPLFIGEVSSTIRPLVREIESLALSVPSSLGKSLQHV